MGAGVACGAQLNSAEFSDVPSLLKPIMHVLLMIWKHSRFYNTPPSLALMLRMLCNKIMEKACDFLESAEALFNLEPKEAVENLQTVLGVCRQTKVHCRTFARSATRPPRRSVVDDRMPSWGHIQCAGRA
jgi:dynein heavy chain